MIYSALYPYSIIQPHKLKGVFDQPISQAPAIPQYFQQTIQSFHLT